MQTLTNHLDPIGRGDAMDQGSGLIKCEQCFKKHEPDSFREFEGYQLCPNCLIEWIKGTIEEDGKAEYQGWIITPEHDDYPKYRLTGPYGERRGTMTIQDAIDFINEL